MKALHSLNRLGRDSDSTHDAVTGEFDLDEICVGDTRADVMPAVETKNPVMKYAPSSLQLLAACED